VRPLALRWYHAGSHNVTTTDGGDCSVAKKIYAKLLPDRRNDSTLSSPELVHLISWCVGSWSDYVIGCGGSACQRQANVSSHYLGIK
jgi:hypothetical protein